MIFALGNMKQFVVIVVVIVQIFDILVTLFEHSTITYMGQIPQDGENEQYVALFF